MNLTPRQIRLIRDTFRKLQPIAGTLAELFQTRLCALAPKFGALFDSAPARDGQAGGGGKPGGAKAGGDWKLSGRQLIRQLRTLISHLDRLDSLTPAIAALGRFRLAGFIQPPDYDLVGQALIWTLARGLEDEFTDEAKIAWLDAYTLLASVMERAIKEKRGDADTLGAPGDRDASAPGGMAAAA